MSAHAHARAVNKVCPCAYARGARGEGGAGDKGLKINDLDEISAARGIFIERC